MKQAIVANSNIKETLDTYPELKQVLMDLSPKFKRMQNVAVYNTLARFANFNDAAKVTGLSVCEILHAINRQLGTEDMLTDDIPQCISVAPVDVEDKSIDIFWREGGDRFIYAERSISSIIQKVIDLQPQQCMVIFSVEKPNELLKVINGLGYSYNLDSQREYRVSVFNTSPMLDVPTWQLDKAHFEVLDARELSGNPFDTILNKAKSIPDNEGFTLIQKFEPLPMINMLVEMGFETVTDKISEGEYHVSCFQTGRIESDSI